MYLLTIPSTPRDQNILPKKRIRWYKKEKITNLTKKSKIILKLA